jgi:hypothetical protein
VTAWQERRAQRRAERRAQHQAQVVGREPGVSDTSMTTEKRRWWRVRRWA